MNDVWRRRFDAFRARYLILAWVLLVVYLPGFDWLLNTIPSDAPSYVELLVGLAWYNLLLIIVIGATLLCYRVPPLRLFGERASLAAFRHGLLLTLFVFMFSIVGVYALFYPLALIAPDIVADWVLTQPDVVIHARGRYPFWPNLLSVLALCVVTPVIEEYVFRGMLLHRWASKWNLRAAVIASSALFGLVHADPIGATAFALAMAWLYLRTQSLWVPILCHALNNFAVWLMEVYFVYRDGPLAEYTLDEFQSDWPWAAWSAVLCLLMVWYAVRRWPQNPALRLPLDIGPTARTTF
ncbi:MAG: lysostaphin resistance A-like protein [Gammaproteobacteria bacterium]